ncbi:MAG: hypothetical protein KBS46_03775 [Clostridiales bacterium]|nr:hypothetical protein [Candidatus Apopatocola equi]
MPSDNTANLRQYRNPLSPEEARENGRKGGLASGESRRRRKAMRDVLSNLMTAEVTEPELKELLEACGLPATQEAAICFAAVKRAQRGDIEACRFVRDTLGEKPVTGVSVAPLYELTAEELKRIDMSQYSDAELLLMIEQAEEVR